MDVKTRIARLVPVALVVLLGACGATPRPPAAVPKLLWPPAPEVPRFALHGILHGEADYVAPPSWFRRVFLGAKKPHEMLALQAPLAVACHPEKNVVYVLDQKQRLIFAFDEDARKLRTYGDVEQGRLVGASALAVDATGTLYASDASAGRVYAYAPDGSVAKVYGHQGDFVRPTGVAVDRGRGRLYVADAKKHVVHVVDLARGTIIATWGQRGKEPLELNFPGFLALDRAGNLLVSDAMNFRYQVISPEGKFLRARGTVGDRPGTFFRLKGLAVDSEAHIYAVDAHFGNFQVFRADGALLISVAQAGRGAGELFLPTGICVTRDDVVWVADQMNARIQGYRYLRNAGVPAVGKGATQPASAPASRPGAVP